MWQLHLPVKLWLSQARVAVMREVETLEVILVEEVLLEVAKVVEVTVVE